MAISNVSTMQKLAAKVSEETLQHAMAITDAEADVRRGPLQLMFDLQSDLGDEMAAMPIVDSENEKGKAPKYSNPDWYQDMTKSTGTTKRSDGVRTSTINEFIDDTSSGQPIVLGTRPTLAGGKEIEGYLNQIAEALKDKALTFKERDALLIEQGYWQGRKTSIRKAYRKAFKCDQYIRQIEEQSGGKLVVDIKRDDDGSPSSSKVPVRIYNKADPEDSWRGSLGSFLSMDLDLAVTNGGSVKDYSNTLNKGTNATPLALVPALKFDDLERTCAAINKLLSIDAAALRSALDRRAKEKDTGNIFAWYLVECSKLLSAAAIDYEAQWVQVNKERDEELKAEYARQAAKRKSA